MGMKDMMEVRRRYKERYEKAAEETKGAFEELDQVSWSLELASLGDVHEANAWIGKIDPNGVKRLPPHGGWDWVKLYHGYLKNPSAFVYALKVEDNVCALLGGGVSDGKFVTKLHYLESAPYHTKISGYVLDISITYVVVLAGEMGSKFTAVYEPNDKVRKIAIEDYDFTDENLFGVSKGFALYLPMSRF